MYTKTQREQLLRRVIEFLEAGPEFEGLVQIGSGAAGFADIYSDIDLMAGCFDEASVAAADESLRRFFTGLGACYTERRAWSNVALGLSVYFENGLSVDISWMPTAILPLRSKPWRVCFSKTERFARRIGTAGGEPPKALDGDIHYRFIHQLRYARIAILRGQFIFADMALGQARQLLLKLQTAAEGKKLHQFKAYNTLDGDFLHKLESAYPAARTAPELKAAEENLLRLYLDTAGESFDLTLLKLLDCFHEENGGEI